MAAKRKTAKQNADDNRRAAESLGMSPDEKLQLIEALKRSRARAGNMPAKNARIDARLVALGG